MKTNYNEPLTKHHIDLEAYNAKFALVDKLMSAPRYDDAKEDPDYVRA